MKNGKDFELSRFVPDSSATDNPVTTGDAQQSKRSVPSATSKPTEQSVPNPQTVSTQSTEPMRSVQLTQPHRTSTRQRKASLDEYREMFMTVPKIIDRQPVFVSRETRDRIDQIVRRLGERKMSVSGFLENLAHHHLELYADDLEQWKRL